MKKLTLVVLMLIAQGAGAQTPDASAFRTALTFNPSTLLTTDPTLMLGVEHRLPRGNASVFLEGGWVMGSIYFNSKGDKASGFAIRPGFRLYHGRRKRDFFGVETFYKQVNYQLYGWLGKDCVNNVPSYSRLQDFDYRKRTFSFNVTSGTLYPIRGRLWMEVYAGLGVKLKWQRPLEENSCYRMTDRLNIYGEHVVTVNAPVGLKLRYLLK